MVSLSPANFPKKMTLFLAKIHPALPNLSRFFSFFISSNPNPNPRFHHRGKQPWWKKRTFLLLASLPEQSNVPQPWMPRILNLHRRRIELPNHPPNAVNLPGASTIDAPTDEEYEVEDLQVAAQYASGLYQFLRSKEVGF
ncbi:hypothetical protein FCM35_KLT13158 [Carex littledalei]|uniref:Uncharacterized protein n=1 Tax=Carex littledalei TaxID=544730 RepID=A0A833QI95_9POAL|nr:hypothetical protein FCM35_KLT13158 [Carex littledalei]